MKRMTDAVRCKLLKRLEEEIKSLPDESIGAETIVTTRTKAGKHIVEKKTVYSLTNLVKAFQELTEDIPGEQYEPVKIVWGNIKPDKNKHNIIIDV